MKLHKTDYGAGTRADVEARLNSFDPEERRSALREMAARAEQGAVQLSRHADVANLHCHTFFSFNAYGHSPTSLAWLARESGWRAAGVIDFDVLDAVDEFLAACDIVGMRGTAGIETRLYVPEYATRELNSPGEPGVSYHIAVGFTTSTAPREVQPILAGFKQRAERRNRDMLQRVNAYLDPVTIDYDRDVLPLTPAGNATERHMLVAYMKAAQEMTADPAAFWADRLKANREEIETLIGDAPKLQNVMRARLMKRGGVGYVQPGPESFPTIAEFNRLVLACGALPCLGWLDGTSAGEANPRELIEFWLSKGVVTLNIIPDRNWNIADPAVRETRLARLYEIVALAEEYDLPLNVGTEMNSYGNKLADDFDVAELAPVRHAFLDGAYFVYGHTALQRALGLGYLSPWAQAHFPGRRPRNRFYAQLGRALKPGPAGLQRLRSLGQDATPEQILAMVEGPAELGAAR